jgi:hypothetical protein
MNGLGAARLACWIALIAPVREISLAAGAGDADMARCAAITQTRARLACFDALAAASADRGAPAPAQNPPPVPIAPAPTAPAPTAPAPAAIAPKAAPDDPRTFGLSPPQPKPTSAGPVTIKARVATMSAGRPGVGHPTVVLDNGQTWAFVEAVDDPRLAPGATVTIKRAVLGSFLLMTASHHTYHVHRTQ